MGRFGLLAILAVIMMLYVSPLKSWFSQRQAAAEHTAEMHQLERENAALRARVGDLRRPEAVEREARRLGMVRGGERPFVLDAP